MEPENSSTEDALAAGATDNPVADTVNASDIDSMDPDEVAAGCFEFRLRARSFDLHQLTHGSKLKKFGRLFHASSDGGVKQASSVPSSPAGGSSPHHSPPRRRRFVRVVRDKPADCTEDGRYVVHKYSEAFLTRMNRERHSSESEYGDRPLPYEVTGHTILKRTALSHSQSINSSNNNSVSGDGESTPTVFKHASFRSEVVVIEFDTKCKVREAPATHVVPLHDAMVDDYDSHAACQRFEDFAETETIAALTKGILSPGAADESGTMQAAESLVATTNGAPSKESVVRLCNEAFILRSAKVYPKTITSFVQQMLSLQSDVEAQELMLALGSLVKNVLFQGSLERSDIAALFPGEFNRNLAGLLVKIFIQRLPQWKHHTADNLVFMPRLVDFDWRVDIKTSSDTLSRMSVPTCLLQLQVQDAVSKTGSIPARECVNVELSQQTLDTMLDGLGRIRDQLSSVVAK